MAEVISTTEGYAKAGIAFIGGCFVGGLSQGLSAMLWGKIASASKASGAYETDALLIAGALTEVGLLLFALGFVGPRLTSSNQLFFTIGGLDSLTASQAIGNVAAGMLLKHL